MAGLNENVSVKVRAALLGVFLFVLAAFAAGFALSCNSSYSHSLPKSPVDSTVAPRSVTIAQAIADAKAYEAPAEVVADPKFDPAVFATLRDEFIRQIEERERRFYGASDSRSLARFTSAAPTGDAGRVTDLTYDDTGRLNWSYVNIGDYDSSGEVGVPDITMIAQNYLAKTNDGVGDDALEAWIDGSGDDEVGIPDITPIAQGYLNDVVAYRILTSSQPDSGFTAIGSDIPFGNPNVFPKTFSVLLPVGVQQYVAVAPVDGENQIGETSESIPISLQIGAADVLAVTPLNCFEGVPFDIWATVNGLPPLVYSWDFGAGITPSTSSESSPTITCNATGEFDCTLTVANDLGADVFNFTISSSLPATPPTIKWVSPQGGNAGSPATFSAGVDGSNPMIYQWNFGGGATPNTSTSDSPTVILGSDGIYGGSLFVANDYGSDSFDFDLTIPFDPFINSPEDTIFLYSPYVGVPEGDYVYVFLCVNVSADKPMANLLAVRILVNNFELIADDFGAFTQSDINHNFENEFADRLIAANSQFYNTWVEFDFWAGFGDQIGVALLASPPLPQATFVDCGVNWGNNAIERSGAGIVGVVKFQAMHSGIAELSIQGRDDADGRRTFYSDLATNQYEFASIGTEIQIVVE
jgi:hypothetical protein